jgi:hypothetical protein
MNIDRRCDRRHNICSRGTLTSDARCDDGHRTNDKSQNNVTKLLKEDSIYIDLNYQKKYIFSSPASVLQGTVSQDFRWVKNGVN